MIIDNKTNKKKDNKMKIVKMNNEMNKELN